MSVEKIVTGTLAERDAKINANFEALDTDKLGKTETAADSSKLGGVAAASYAKTADMNSAIEAAKSAVKDELIDGAPDTYDTLKEIAVQHSLYILMVVCLKLVLMDLTKQYRLMLYLRIQHIRAAQVSVYMTQLS